MSDQNETRRELLNLRYGGQAKPPIVWNDQIEALIGHRSTRTYLPDPLPEHAIETMVVAAQSASTSSNLHQWSVVAVTDPSMKAQLGELARREAHGKGNPYIDEAPAFLLWIADLSRNNAISREADKEPVVHAHVDALLMGVVDASVAAQNAAIAAESLGLGVVYIGAVRNKAQEVADLIGLPDNSFVVFGMCVGWPDPTRPSRMRPRPVLDVVLHRDRYDPERTGLVFPTYETAMEDFQNAVGLKDGSWRSSVETSASDMDYMDGRENLREALDRRGFRLR